MRLSSVLTIIPLLGGLTTLDAADVDQFEVLGLHLGDRLETVIAELKEQGFDTSKLARYERDLGPYVYFTLSDWNPHRSPAERTVMIEIGHATGLYKLDYIQEPISYSALRDVTQQVCQKYGTDPEACRHADSGLMIWRDDDDLSKTLKVRVTGSLEMRLEDRDAYFTNIRDYRRNRRPDFADAPEILF